MSRTKRANELTDANAARPINRKPLLKAVSIVIPCRNESANLHRITKALLEKYGQYIMEIILVDDASSDNSAEIMKKLSQDDWRIRPVFRKPPCGVGRALKDGFKSVRGDYVLMMDCDFLLIINEVDRLFEAAARGFDVAIGSRFFNGEALEGYPMMKLFFNRSWHLVASALLHRPIHDVTNNLKLMKREVLENLDLKATGFSVNAETGLQPLFMGFKCAEVPMAWRNRKLDMGTSSFSLLKNGVGYMKALSGVVWATAFGLRALPRRFSSWPQHTEKSLPAKRAQG